VRPGRRAWLQVARGVLRAGDAVLRAGDGLAMTASGDVALEAAEDAEFLLFDLAA
jgi:hypothetical protein